MPSLLAEFPSSQFYDGKLMTAPALSSVDGALYFIDVSGEEHGSFNQETADHKTYVNKKEAQKIIRFLNEEFQPDKLEQIKLAGQSIVILTFYTAQVSVIWENLKDTEYQFIKVMTVDKFQGNEADYVLVSFVRTHFQTRKLLNIGFLADYRRINVALTRAKQKLFMFGNIRYLASVSDLFKELFEYLITKNLVCQGGFDGSNREHKAKILEKKMPVSVYEEWKTSSQLN
jgi:superfamily I DNA and/or RNA helicase